MIDDSLVARLWDGNARAWGEQVRRGYDTYRERINNPALFDLIGSLSGREVLDLGCGEGYNTRLLARGARRTVGVDISPEMIALARQAEEEAPLGIRYHVASFSNLSIFAEGSFDLAVSSMALMDGADYAGAVAEAARILRPGGSLVFSILHPCFATPALEWLRDESGEKARLVVGRYFERSRYIETWSFSRSPIADRFPPFQVPRFQRTLADYLNPLAQHGLSIERIGEPQPSEAQCRADPSLAKWRRHAALFLHIKAVKPCPSS